LELTTNDRLWLALNCYHEARGETFTGMVAVCHVVLNRMQSRRFGCVKDVVLQPWQFSWGNEGARPAIKDYASLEKCFEAADVCLAEREAGNILEGAEYYFADYIDPPTWSKDMTKVCKIGRHTFFKV
jgi:spore germination cell wall hydrolase CwlJ-like protein